jgi:hypothetical protein
MKVSKKNLICIFAAFFTVTAAAVSYQTFFRAKPSFVVIDPLSIRPHILTYASLPQGFTHTGRLLFFKSQKDTDTKEIASKALAYTGYYKTSKLERDICGSNGIKSGTVPAGVSLIIPHSVPALVPDSKKRVKSPLIFTRGLYYTGSNAGSEKVISSLDSIVEAGINTIVFDAKDITGIVNYNSHVPEVGDLELSKQKSIEDIDKLIRLFKSRGIYVIARIAVFRDQLLAKKAPELAVRSRSTGRLWNEGKEVWCDPTNRETQDYNLALAIELAEKGVDEIQLDYIRFPTGANSGDANYAWSFGSMPRDKAIEFFLSRAYKEISSRNVNLSIDVFGVIAWGHDKDIMTIGQRVNLLSKYCDVMSPMLYPSHFSDNFDGYSKPGDAPYYFINTGCAKFKEQSSKALVRPWLQAFNWRVSNYNEKYILDQISGSNNAKAHGYLFWNAANNYDTVLKALKSKKMQPERNVSYTGAKSPGENL